MARAKKLFKKGDAVVVSFRDGSSDENYEGPGVFLRYISNGEPLWRHLTEACCVIQVDSEDVGSTFPVRCVRVVKKGEVPLCQKLDVPSWLLDKTFCVEYSPNCQSKWLVRMPGRGGVIDKKQYVFTEGKTCDALGFGATLAEAAEKALAAQVQQKKG